jgi:hypothetical protein
VHLTAHRDKGNCVMPVHVNLIPIYRAAVAAFGRT